MVLFGFVVVLTVEKVAGHVLEHDRKGRILIIMRFYEYSINNELSIPNSS